MANSDSNIIKLNVGDIAPDFTLQTHIEGELNFGWYQGRKNVVLAFYPGDFTLFCSNQIPTYNKILPELEKYNCQLFAISVDSVDCHKAWAKSLGGIYFPLMSDYFPHGGVAKKYGIFNEEYGCANRTVFLVDINGKIRFIDNLQYDIIPDNDKLLKELAKL